MRVVGLFAGIGGLELGLAAAGHNTVIMCEIWEPARAVLSTRFPHTDLERNIVELRDFPSGTEVVVAGFPCQDLSQAGMTRLHRDDVGYGRGRTVADHQAHPRSRKIAQAKGVRMGCKPKLTPHQREEARQRIAKGESTRDVAKSYHVSVSRISRLAA
jgi:hypothetical protein